MALIAALAVALPALAALQYHWVGQVSEAELDRMQSHLRQQTAQFGEEFNAAIRGAFNDGAPLLIAPRFRRPPLGGPPPRLELGRPGPPPRGFLIAELDPSRLVEELIPELVRKHFAPDYDIRVVSRADPTRLIYQSD